MRLWVAATVVMIVSGIVVWIAWGDRAVGQGIALSLVGIGSVIGVSLVFYLVGKSEDAERAASAAAQAGPEPDEPGDEPGTDPHPRPALDRRRPMPPRRPS